MGGKEGGGTAVNARKRAGWDERRWGPDVGAWCSKSAKEGRVPGDNPDPC